MTFEEAKNEINKHYDILFPQVPRKHPPHDVIGAFVSVKDQIQPFHWGVFDAIKYNHIDNKNQLDILGVLEQPLAAFVRVKMWGYEITIPLDSYLTLIFAVESAANSK